jgi:DNA polymerase family A
VPSAADHCAIVVVGDLAAIGGSGDHRLAWAGSVGDLAAQVAVLERASQPRWVMFAAGTVLPALLPAGVRLARSHDIAEVHRLLAGGWRAEPQVAWAHVQGFAEQGLPRPPTGDLFDPEPEPGDPAEPTLPSGYLRPDAFTEWAVGCPARVGRLAGVALETAAGQVGLLSKVSERAGRLAWSESAAAVLCAELEHDGLPFDVPAALELIATAAGPRPLDPVDAVRIRRERDLRVLFHQPGRENTDLRNPASVLQLLTSAGVVVDNTRKWTLQPFRDTHPVVAALLDWRRDERIATTYGYSWLDSSVGADGRLRGAWTACDGGGGRMTAQNGLHNLPALLRSAIAAEPGHVFVRADLGQIEPRVLAVVSGDPAFAEATRADDLYAPVAAKLGSDRATAKVAVLAAMYGQRSGAAGRALGDLERAYPVAMAYLDDAYRHGVAGRSVRTFGGRLIRAALPSLPTDGGPGAEPTDPVVSESSGAAGSRGRYLRNAVIQGAAAELFKAWAATVRSVVADLGGQIVLCLHDELLVHVPEEQAQACAALVEQALVDSARRWARSDRVRFVADTSVIRRWSEAKG